MKRTSALALLLLTLILSAASLVSADPLSFAGTLESSDPTWDRVQLGCSGPSGQIEWYDTYNFTVSDGGQYTLETTGVVENPADPDNFDPILALYEGAFDPTAPSSNCLKVDDDSGPFLNARIMVELVAGQTYILVVTQCCDGTAPEQSGSYSIGARPSVAGDDVRAACAISDGRINRDAQDCAAPVAIYLSGSPTNIDVYAIDPGSGSGKLAIHLTTADVDAVGVPAENTLLISATNPKTGQLISVYRLNTGEFQLNTTYQDGKSYIVVWDANGELYHLAA